MKSKINIFHMCKKCMYFRALFELVGTIFTSLVACYMSAFVDDLATFRYQQEVGIAVKLTAIFVLQLCFVYCRNRYWKAYREKTVNRLERQLYYVYLETSGNTENESQLSIICEKDLMTCLDYYTETIPLGVQALIGVFVYAGFLFAKTGGVSVLILLVLLGLFQFLPPMITQKYLVQNYIRAGQEEAKVRQQVVSGLSGIFTIKMLNLHDWYQEKYLIRQKEFQKAGERAAATSSLQAAMDSGVSLIQQLGFLVIGALGVMLGWFSLGSLLGGYVLSASFYQYMARIGRLRAQRAVCDAALKRIETLVSVQEDHRELFGDFSFALPQNGIWLVKGENGAGKSTLLSIVAGYWQSEMRISWRGADMDARTRLSKVGWCPQLYQQFADSFDELLVLIPNENLNEDDLNTCLALFDVGEELRKKPLNNLSGGEQKKLMLSLAFSQKRDILLLDEPEVSLDQDSVTVLKGLLEKDERLILLVTHLTEFDDLVAGRIYVERGKINVSVG